MTYKQEEFTPVNDLILVQPGPVREITQYMEVPDDEKNKGKGINDVKAVKTVKNKIKTVYRVGKIISMSNRDNLNYNVGDWIVYNEYDARKLDLLAKKEPDLKCPVVVKHYGVIAKVENDKLN